MNNWSIEQARELYNIVRWSDGFFDINEKGNIIAYPDGQRNHSGIDLADLAQTLQAEGLCLPILVRFNDILKQRFAHVRQAFAQSIQEYGYKGNFTSVYPIKVNQQRHVIEQILHSDEHPVGLEAGSKPELIAVLALSKSCGSVVVCNGYKDREYIRLALIGQRLGLRVYLILEKLNEVDIILEEAKKNEYPPTFGYSCALGFLCSRKMAKYCGRKIKIWFFCRTSFTRD